MNLVSKQKNDFNSLSPFFSDFFTTDRTWKSFKEKSSFPAVNIKKNEDAYHIDIAAPGINKNDFKIDLENNFITISYEQSESIEKENGKLTHQEFHSTSFKRRFKLEKEKFDIENIKATHENGILTIEIPKAANQKPTKTSINIQ